MTILGVNISRITLDQVMTQIMAWLKTANQYYIVTVNPEFLVAAQANPLFRQVLNQADIATCDGFGLKLASMGKLSRVTGVDLTKELLSNMHVKAYLLGGEPGVAGLVAKKYPKTVVGASCGGKLNTQTWLLEKNQSVIQDIIDSQANILIVALGQIKEEIWIYKNLDQMPNIKVAIGVGSTFNYLSGKVKQAPSWLRQLGLEWLYKLIIQPHRYRRIFNAVIVFPYLAFKDRLQKK